MMPILRRITIALIIAVGAVLWLASPALAFCGFYVSQANSNLYNQASQVIIARDGDRTVLTMANDYQGDVNNFALVVPVPVLLTEEQVRVGDPTILERLDTFSAPRLVEYFDENPCAVNNIEPRLESQTNFRIVSSEDREREDALLGVTVESRFSVGEYDIVILSATESNGLETWLDRNGYQIPPQASELLQPYIRQEMKFFVAKVNIEAFNTREYQSLRPLMMAFESPKFMLPIRLGTANAQQEQDLIVYLLSPKGQIELTNYRTAQIPSDEEVPEFVQDEFGDFYKAMFQTSHDRQQRKVAFLEYAWDMGWCDPCAANPLSREELQQAGVFWLENTPNRGFANNVFITRLHLRYTRDKFPEDLQFQETGNRQNFQGRYVIRHPYQGEDDECEAMEEYRNQLRQRQEREVETLARLTGWDISEIRDKVDFANSNPKPWWHSIWN